MTNPEWEAVERAMGEVLELPESERSAYLQQLAPEVRAEVESLLSAHFRANSFLEQPTSGPEKSRDLSGHRIGPYQVERVLGEGGMGVVYEASRADDQFRQRVALKLIRGAAYSEAAHRRFRQERQILATLAHPHIARLLDGGVTPEGQPYFVIEYIDGQPLHKYCDDKKLRIRERLLLFRDVCAAVQYAHQNLVVHRDLKPSNILVTPEGQVKLLDFGIAKLLGDQDDPAEPMTMTGAHLMTPEYASPEQVRGDNVTTATDVYSLGVILYELLTGTRPFQIKQRVLTEIARVISEQEPVKPSTAASQSGTASIPGTAPQNLRRELAGDLDNIILLALRKEPGQRYASAEALSEDIRRYLGGEPVRAHPPTVRYRAAKFVRRHKTAFAAACLLVLSLSGGIAATWRQKLKADQESAKVKAVNDFLQKDLLAQASSSAQSGGQPDPEIKVRTVLDRAAQQIAGKFERQPLVEASIRQTIGSTYMDLGLYPEAQKNFERALDLNRRVLGQSHADTVEAMHNVAQSLGQQGKYAEAEPLFLKVLDLHKRVLGPENPETLMTMHDLALLYWNDGKNGEAEPLYTKALETQKRVLGPEHPDTLGTMSDLALVYWKEGKDAQAEPLFRTALDARKRVLGPDHPDTLVSMNCLSALYLSAGKYTEAEPYAAGVYEGRKRVLGPEHPRTLTAMDNLAVLYSRQGKLTQAEPLVTQAVELYGRVLGPEHPDTLIGMNNLAALYEQEARYPEAEALYLKTFEIERRVLGPEHPETLLVMSNLGEMYLTQGKDTKAEPLFVQALDAQRRVVGLAHSDTFTGIGGLSALYMKQGKYAQAEALLRETWEAQQKAKVESWRRYRCESLLGESLAGQKKFAEAEPLLLSGYEGLRERQALIPWARRSILRDGAEWIARLYESWGKQDKAAEWRAKRR